MPHLDFRQMVGPFVTEYKPAINALLTTVGSTVLEASRGSARLSQPRRHDSDIGRSNGIPPTFRTSRPLADIVYKAPQAANRSVHGRLGVILRGLAATVVIVVSIVDEATQRSSGCVRRAASATPAAG